MKKFLIGLSVGAVMLIAGMIVGQIFQLLIPEMKMEYQNPNLFRPWSDPLMSLMFVEPFLLGFIFVWLWEKTKTVINGDTQLERGLKFGLIYWAVTFPGMIMSYSSFPVSFTLVLSWTLSGLIQAICAGILLSKWMKY